MVPVLVAVVGFTTGCMELELEDSVSSAQFMAASSNRLSGNRLSGNRLSGNRLSGNSLTADLSSLGGMHETPEGQEYLTYLVKCALPEGTDLIILDDDNVTELHRFPGLLGLTPEWENRALTPSEQRWLSACLLAHVNFFGITVSISVRGNHPALVTDDDEKLSHHVKEGAFFGNVFEDQDGDGLADLSMFACSGRDKTLGVSSASLDDRACTEPDPENPGFTRCGFVYTGECATENDALDWSCEDDGGDDGSYKNCHTAPRSPGIEWDSSADKFEEVLTIYVAE